MRTKNVLCFGSLNIDYTYTVPHFVGKGETLPAAGLHVFCGGKGLNQSIALSRAGLDVHLAGAIGEDGRFLLDYLRDAGVDTRYIAILPDVRTGHAIIQNDAEGDNCILVYGGANCRTTRSQADRVLADFGPGDVLMLQNEINDLSYIISAAKDRGMTIALTPAPMTEEVRRLPLRELDYLFLNENECRRLLDARVDPEAEPLCAARELRRCYTDAAVILTLGAQGAVYVSEAEEHVQPAAPARAVDTTGAGDTFTGYFLAGRLGGFDVKQAMGYAAQAAAIAITRPGASASIPTREEVLAAWNG